MINWKFWQTKARTGGSECDGERLRELSLPPGFTPTVQEDDYWFLIDDQILRRRDEFIAAEEWRLERSKKIGNSSWTYPTKHLPGLPPREYKFDEPEGHKPIAPRSALFVPRPLSMLEREARGLLDLLEGIEPNPKLAKKLKDDARGSYRVVFDDKGKMKKAKQTATTKGS